MNSQQVYKLEMQSIIFSAFHESLPNTYKLALLNVARDYETRSCV